MLNEGPSATCRHCGHSFPVRKEQIGGIVTCPSCGKAVEVEGLNDPWWTGMKVIAAIGWAGIVAAVYVNTHGFGPAVLVAAGVGLAIWLVSLAM